MARQTQKKFWMYPAENEKLTRLCQLTGLPESGVIRSLILDTKLYPLPPVDFHSLSRELNAIGNNINQVVMNIHYMREVTPQQMQELTHKLDECYELLSRYLMGNHFI